MGDAPLVWQVLSVPLLWWTHFKRLLKSHLSEAAGRSNILFKAQCTNVRTYTRRCWRSLACALAAIVSFPVCISSPPRISKTPGPKTSRVCHSMLTMEAMLYEQAIVLRCRQLLQTLACVSHTANSTAA